jgi:hypothetical protein
MERPEPMMSRTRHNKDQQHNPSLTLRRQKIALRLERAAQRPGRVLFPMPEHETVVHKPLG